MHRNNPQGVNTGNPFMGAAHIDRYLGSSFDIVYAVYKELDNLPVIYDFAIEFMPKMEQILDENTEILGKLTEIDQAVITSTEAATSAENSANTTTIHLNSIEHLHSEVAINKDKSFQYRNDSFQYKNDAEDSAAAAKESENNASQFVNDAISTVRADLANPDMGAAMVGFRQVGAGAVPRTMLDKSREFVSVKDFGAVGDGASNDTLAFTSLESAFKGQMVNLSGQKFAVDTIPSENGYYNGSFVVGGFTKPALLNFTPFAATPRYQLNGGQLNKLRRSLSDPLEQLTSIVFIGDSITWGSGNSPEMAPTQPRTGILSDPRDYFGTSSFVNIFKRWIGSNYFENASPIVSNWDVSIGGESTVEYSRDIVLWPRDGLFTLSTTGTSVNVTETFVDNSATSASSPTWRQLNLTWTTASGENPHSITFRFTGEEFSLFYGLTSNSNGKYEVIVDGDSLGVFTNILGNDGGVVGNSNSRVHQFEYKRNALVEIRAVNDPLATTTQLLRITGLGIRKTCRIINQGINGASADGYVRNALSTQYTSTPAIGAKDNFVFIQLGTNDRSNPRTGNQKPGAENNLYTKLKDVVDKVLELSAANVVLMVANPAISEVPEKRMYTMQQVRGETLLLAGDMSLDAIDNYSIFNGIEMRRYASDLLHPNQFGHSIMASNIIGALEQS